MTVSPTQEARAIATTASAAVPPSTRTPRPTSAVAGCPAATPARIVAEWCRDLTPHAASHCARPESASADPDRAKPPPGALPCPYTNGIEEGVAPGSQLRADFGPPLPDRRKAGAAAAGW